MTAVYRLVRRERSAEALSGEGARLYGGRWNPPGVPVVYAAESRALAVLEAFVHLTLEARFMRFELCTIELPARTRVTRYDGDRPPPALGGSQGIGRRWVEEAATLALVVPFGARAARVELRAQCRAPPVRRSRGGPGAVFVRSKAVAPIAAVEPEETQVTELRVLRGLY